MTCGAPAIIAESGRKRADFAPINRGSRPPVKRIGGMAGGTVSRPGGKSPEPGRKCEPSHNRYMHSGLKSSFDCASADLNHHLSTEDAMQKTLSPTQAESQAVRLLDEHAAEAKTKRPQGLGRAERGLDAVASQPEGFGRFGRMFPELARA